MRYRIDNQILFWLTTIFILLPMVWLSFDKEMTDFEFRILTRTTAAIFLYIVYRYYLVQGGSTYGKGILFFLF